MSANVLSTITPSAIKRCEELKNQYIEKIKDRANSIAAIESRREITEQDINKAKEAIEFDQARTRSNEKPKITLKKNIMNLGKIILKIGIISLSFCIMFSLFVYLFFVKMLNVENYNVLIPLYVASIGGSFLLAKSIYENEKVPQNIPR